MNPKLTRAAALALAGACLSTVTAQTTVSIIADRDNTLFDDTNGSLSSGLGHIYVGLTASGFGAVRRGLMHFDVAGSIPAGAVVLGAQLDIEIDHTVAPGADDLRFHRVLQDWGEGTSGSLPGAPPFGGGGGSPATVGDATWLHTFSATGLWTTVGGDFNPAASFKTIMLSPGQPFTPIMMSAVNPPGLIADVQDMIDNPANNFGWLLKVNESGMVSARRLKSREDPGNKPTLNVTYLLESEVGTWGVGCPVGAGNFDMNYSGAAIGGQTITVQRSNAVPSSIGGDFWSLGLDAAGITLQTGCTAYLPFSMELVPGDVFLTDAAGNSGTFAFPVPAGFPGFMITTQSAVLDSSPLGLSLSNAAVMILQ